jgi:hypothetical protein
VCCSRLQKRFPTDDGTRVVISTSAASGYPGK